MTRRQKSFSATPLFVASSVMVAIAGTLVSPAAEDVDLPPAAMRQVDYQRDIEPLLTKHCAGCHGADKQESRFRVDRRRTLLKGGEFGEPGVIPGRSAESHLIRLVAGVDPNFVMPPKGKRLTAEEIGLLRAWIDQGVTMPEAAVDAGALTTEHWSFQPIARPLPPRLNDAWVSNPVDAFILARQQEAGLAPSPPADRATLMRRLFLDVLGLLPTPEQLDEFVNDLAPDAYPKLVERVLASPHYGERWARHWLDVVRFAESNGFETNIERPTAYYYRDYVIDAFNRDKPYDRFVFEQLAGDAVGADAATGFLVGGPYDRVKSPDPVLTAMQRQDELADIVNTTGTTFLGLTLGCARCHNHKFDPVLQQDYYSLQAVFAGVQHGERELRTEANEAKQQQAAELTARIESLQAELARLQPSPFHGHTVLIDDEDAPHVQLLAEKRGHGTNPGGKERGYRDDPGEAGRLPNVSGGRYTWWSNQPGIDVAAYTPGVAGRYRVWLSWGSGWHTHTSDARYLLDADGNPATQDDRREIAAVNQQLFCDGTGKPVSKPLWSGFYHAGVHELTEASLILLRGGQTGEAITADVIVLQEAQPDEQQPLAPRLLPPVNAKLNEERFPPITAKVVRFTIDATNSFEPCLDELEIWTAEQPSRNVALASAGGKPSSSGNYVGNPKHKLEHINDGRYGNDWSWISNTEGERWVQIELAEPAVINRITWGRDRLEQYNDRLPTKYKIEVTTEPDQWRAVAGHTVRVPAGLGPAEGIAYRTVGLSPQDAATAAKLGGEIEKLETARQALLEIPKVYAGTFMQPPPTHRLYRGDPLAKREPVPPESLVVLHDAVGSLDQPMDAPEQKRRIKLAEWIIDPANPLTARVMVNRLWHYHFGRGIVATPSDFGAMGVKPTHPHLLDWLASELVENGWSLKHLHRLILRSNTYQQASTPQSQALAKDKDSTLLWRYPPRRLEAEAIRDNILFVSGALDERMTGPGFMLFHPNSNYSRNWIAKDEFGPAEFRRMVYALKLRMEQDAVFGAFDCPDGGQIAPRRPRSTTPIQALNLFNSDFVLQQAERLAQRVRQEAGENPQAQVERVFRLTLGRKPEDAEATDAAELVQTHGLETLCRAMLNTNEFLFLP